MPEWVRALTVTESSTGRCREGAGCWEPSPVLVLRSCPPLQDVYRTQPGSAERPGQCVSSCSASRLIDEETET